MLVAPRLTAIALTTLGLVACKSHHDDHDTTAVSKPGSSGANNATAAPTSGTIPKATAPIKIDGDWHDPDWNKSSLQFKFHGLSGDDTDVARPYSEVRFVHDDTRLYVGLYASDNNILSSDAFDLMVGSLAVQITAAGKLIPETPEIQAAVDRDGTLDDPRDHDEEWKVELSMPLDRVGLSPGKKIDARAARCDTPLGETKRCGEWSGQLTIE